jgi:hypothetical protein
MPSVPEPNKTWVGVGVVMFNAITAIPGASTLQIMAASKTRRTMPDGSEWYCPQIWYDKEYKCIRIGNRAYDLSRVHYWEFAPPIKEEKDLTDNTEKYTIGKRIIVK